MMNRQDSCALASSSVGLYWAMRPLLSLRTRCSQTSRAESPGMPGGCTAASRPAPTPGPRRPTAPGRRTARGPPVRSRRGPGTADHCHRQPPLRQLSPRPRPASAAPLLTVASARGCIGQGDRQRRQLLTGGRPRDRCEGVAGVAGHGPVGDPARLLA
jgi:hypothetical protein